MINYVFSVMLRTPRRPMTENDRLSVKTDPVSARSVLVARLHSTGKTKAECPPAVSDG